MAQAANDYAGASRPCRAPQLVTEAPLARPQAVYLPDDEAPQMIALDLPYPPSVNTYWRTVNGRMLISAEGRAYRFAVAAHAVDQRVSPGFQTGALWVQIMVTAPDNRRRDLDNLLKATLDALNGITWADDSQIENIQIAWANPRVAPGGKLRVLVGRLDWKEGDNHGHV
jgi:crossover junction endodeoxyribonuclease RusA